MNVTTKFGMLANGGTSVELVQKPTLVLRTVLGEVCRYVYVSRVIDAKGNISRAVFEVIQPGDQIDWTNYTLEPETEETMTSPERAAALASLAKEQLQTI